jgi:hypothetical protein
MHNTGLASLPGLSVPMGWSSARADLSMTGLASTRAKLATERIVMKLQYRKKPVVIEAFQMTRERRNDNSDWPAWLNDAWKGEPNKPGTVQRTMPFDENPTDELEIMTLEGIHRVNWGDWIIRGVQGELYPCKPEIFAATYEPA